MKILAPDKKALKILLDTYWGSGGWKTSRETTAVDFEYARAAGLMFHPSAISHDEITSRAARIAKDINHESIADSFITSLGSRRLELRSALGSFAVLRHFPLHDASVNERQCRICGEYMEATNEDLSVLNFERFKWGGVRHDHPRYAVFDIEQFLTTSHPSPTKEDINILGSLFAAIESAPENTTADTLEKFLAPIVKSNQSERQTLIAILGLTGTLGTSHHPGYLNSFAPYYNRNLPNRRFVDMTYPACWWSRTDGINWDAVNFWFGHRLNKSQT
jgi:hypothetical protein